VAAECEEDFGTSIVHSMNRADRVVAMIARRFEIKGLTQPIKKSLGRSFPNTNRAITLYVAVTAHRTQTRTGVSNLATQQHQVDDLLDVCDGVAMLCEAHGPAEDCALRGDKDLRGLFDQFSSDATLLDDLFPRNVLQSRYELVESVGVASNEVSVE